MAHKLTPCRGRGACCGLSTDSAVCSLNVPASATAETALRKASGPEPRLACQCNYLTRCCLRGEQQVLVKVSMYMTSTSLDKLQTSSGCLMSTSCSASLCKILAVAAASLVSYHIVSIHVISTIDVFLYISVLNWHRVSGQKWRCGIDLTSHISLNPLESTFVQWRGVPS